MSQAAFIQGMRDRIQAFAASLPPQVKANRKFLPFSLLLLEQARVDKPGSVLGRPYARRRGTCI